MVIQRVIVHFARGNELKFISHLDMMRLWVRALNRSEIPVAYSQGFSPHPRIALAAPLAVGVTGESELLDLHLEKRVSLQSIYRELARVLPTGISVDRVEEFQITAPSLQASIRSASYQVETEMTMTLPELENSIDRVLKAQSLPRTRMRDGKTKTYDLRPLILALRVEQVGSCRAVLAMVLRQDNSAAGRPDEVTAELGFIALPNRIHRTGLVFSE